MARDENTTGGAPDRFDPELAEDLGAELPLRGDQLEAALEQARAEADGWRDKAAQIGRAHV